MGLQVLLWEETGEGRLNQHAIRYYRKLQGKAIMTVGFDQPLYILPFDHRGSFQTKMFGWEGDLTPSRRRKSPTPSR